MKITAAIMKNRLRRDFFKMKNSYRNTKFCDGGQQIHPHDDKTSDLFLRNTSFKTALLSPIFFTFISAQCFERVWLPSSGVKIHFESECLSHIVRKFVVFWSTCDRIKIFCLLSNVLRASRRVRNYLTNTDRVRSFEQLLSSISWNELTWNKKENMMV